MARSALSPTAALVDAHVKVVVVDGAVSRCGWCELLLFHLCLLILQSCSCCVPTSSRLSCVGCGRRLRQSRRHAWRERASERLTSGTCWARGCARGPGTARRWRARTRGSGRAPPSGPGAPRCTVSPCRSRSPSGQCPKGSGRASACSPAGCTCEPAPTRHARRSAAERAEPRKDQRLQKSKPPAGARYVSFKKEPLVAR